MSNKTHVFILMCESEEKAEEIKKSHDSLEMNDDFFFLGYYTSKKGAIEGINDNYPEEQ